MMIKHIGLLFLFIFFTACAAPKQQIQFENVLRYDHAFMAVNDNRPSQERKSKRVKLTDFVIRLGEDNFSPRPIEVLDAKAAYLLRKLGYEKSIEIDHFEILNFYGYSASQNRTKEPYDEFKSSTYTPSVPLVGPVNDSDFIQCNLNGAIAGQTFSVHAVEPYDIKDQATVFPIESRLFRKSVKAATEHCIDKAIGKIKSLTKNV